MLDIKFIRENKELIQKNSDNRRVGVNLDALLKKDEQRRKLIQEKNEKESLRNKAPKSKPSEEERQNMRKLGEEIKELESTLNKVESEYKNLLRAVPNLMHPETPIGGEEDFKVLEEHGKPPKFNFEAKDHESLMTNLDLIDFERGAKVAGNKFYFAKNELVRLNQALINYGIDVVTKHGFTLMETPDLAKGEILSGIGFEPRGPESQIYSIEKIGSEDPSGLCLIGTAEITVGGYHAEEILDLSKGPKKYVALSHCFRTEAGSYGRESKGLYRVHQFTKLEMFVFCKPEDSEKMHEEILNIEKELVKGLDFPYRVIDIASGDLGAPAYRKFDIEAWMVMKDGYGEITSTSNCTDYQARRLNIRYRKQDGDLEFVHTLNGTALNNSRFPIALMENFQTKEGTVKIPEVLQPYMGGIKEIK